MARCGKNQVSLSSIAEESKVSRRIVSAVLEPKPSNASIGFSKETRKKVEKTAMRLGYRPNRTWKNAVCGRNGQIGILASDISIISGGHNVVKIVSAAKASGFLVTMEMVGQSKGLPLFLRENVVDGLLVFEDLGKEACKAIIRHNLPCVHVNANVHDCGSGIHLDEAGAIHSAFKCFVEEGRKQVAMILHGVGFFNDLRRAALRQACSDAGMAPPLELTTTPAGDFTSNVRDPIREFCRVNPDIDAIILHQSKCAQHCYNALMAAGKSVPRDVSVIGLDDEPFDNVEPMLSTFSHARDHIECAVIMLCGIIEGKRKSGEQITVKYVLKKRKSTL